MYCLYYVAPKQNNKHYDIVLKTVNCSFLEDFVVIRRCDVQTQQGRTGINYEDTHLKNISSFLIHVYFYTERKGNFELLMEQRDVNFCKLITDSFGFSRFITIFLNSLGASGELPKKCPILAGTRANYNMVNVDPASFPFLPEITFKFVIVLDFDSVHIIENSLDR